ncbi:hypothetical protein [Fulvivirga ligni]|uniref:hypothetical protein n=1 Tax=Fulvivirga ligni TaxID=2904246 RepID=UPI001F2839B3|nr:hypothetical protein [Fulvivirga ligni]UII23527.1 hypothetical protein LVD16_09835 [Fulvivirga ligni]
MRPGKGKKIALGIVAAIAFVTVFGWVVMSLWNWLVPELFNGPVVTFWQAIGLLILSKILFGGFHGKGGHGPKEKWKERWRNMTPEQRDKLKQRFSSRWADCEGPRWGKKREFSNQDWSEENIDKKDQ